MIHKEFVRCSTLDDVYLLLSKCSTITPNIALGAMERIFKIQDESLNSRSVDTTGAVPNPDLLQKLSNIIISTDDIYALLRAFNLCVSKNDVYLNIFCDEILKRVTDNKLSIFQVCDVVASFGSNKKDETLSENVEKLWIGLIGREKEFDEKSAIKCFSILNHLKASRKIVLRVLERRMFTLWWQIKSDSVIEILNSFIKNNIFNSKIMPVLGKWMNTNIHTLSEDNLFEITVKLNMLNYTDSQIERALERYVKFKGLNIKLDTLVVAIMNHCSLFKIRNPHILSGCAEYFIINGRQLSPMFIKPVLYPFGYLNFHPSNGLKFWEAVENVLEENFLKISIEDMLDIMLACVYLEKYPINFIPKIFNAHFLDKINSSENAGVLRSKLKLLDTALSLECKAHKGPLLPKDHGAKSYLYDGRVKRLLNHTRESFEIAAGGVDCFSTFVVLPYIYTTNLYIIDVMFHPPGLRSSMLNWNLKKDRNVNVALLIHVPEHFCSYGDTLLGPQVMRIKHLRILGLKVVNLKYEILSRLRMHTKELNKYIVENIKKSQSAL
ncbi:FAST kinase domain-containing protein 3, mitochondrial-like isoform X2 [Arctopsyche grandis]